MYFGLAVLMTSLRDCLGDSLGEVRGRLTFDAPLGSLTYFGVGGVADLLFQPSDIEDLSLFLEILPLEVPVFVMGLGSNLLVRDGGVEGVVIRLTKGFGGLECVNGTRLRVGTAVPDRRLSGFALDNNLGGFEFFYGIPGCIGGALRMNAGANGRETCDLLIEADAIDRRGVRHTFGCEDMGYSYRHSRTPKDLIFVSALFEGYGSSRSEIEGLMSEVKSHRNRYHPVGEKTGGSTFKNPVSGSSWRLIESAGLRNRKIGGASFSSLHCNFLINDGSATSHDLESLGELARSRVYEDSGILLDWEIIRLGRFESGREVTPFEP